MNPLLGGQEKNKTAQNANNLDLLSTCGLAKGGKANNISYIDSKDEPSQLLDKTANKAIQEHLFKQPKSPLI